MRQGSLRVALPWILLLALAFGLRVWGLGEKLVWHDEVATRIFAAGFQTDDWKVPLYSGRIVDRDDLLAFQHFDPSRSTEHAVMGLVRDDPQHPPLYYVIARLWTGAFGDGIGTLRMLSVIFGVAAVPLIFWLAWELFGDRRAAWISAVLVAVSPFFVLYAQEAREYAMWASCVLLATACLLRAIRRTVEGVPTVGTWLGYSLSLVLALYTSFSSSSFILAHIVTVIWSQRGRVNRVSLCAAAAMAGAAACFLPWAIGLLRHWDSFQTSMAWSREIVIPRSALLRIFAFNFSRVIADFWAELDRPVAWVVMVGAATLGVGACWNTLRRCPGSAAVLVPLLVAPLGLLLVPDLLQGGIRSVSSRYLTPSWIALELALAFALSRAGRGPAMAKGVVLALGLGSGLFQLGTKAPWTKGPSRSLPQVADWVNASPRPLLVGGVEGTAPGNLMALANLLRPGVQLQLLQVEQEAVWRPPDGFSDLFLFSPIPPYREALEERQGQRAELLVKDLYLELWVLRRR